MTKQEELAGICASLTKQFDSKRIEDWLDDDFPAIAIDIEDSEAIKAALRAIEDTSFVCNVYSCNDKTFLSIYDYEHEDGEE